MAMPHTLAAATEIEAAPLNENFTYLLAKVEALEARKSFKVSVPAAVVAREPSKEYEPSATQDMTVYLDLVGTTSTAIIGTIKVGGVTVGKVGIAPVAGQANEILVTFQVPAGKKWELASTFGIVEMKTSYQALD